MSQFSYGALESYARRGELLPVPGGFDAADTLTRDPSAIEASQRPLPIGYWKGSGLALLLDAVAAITALGNATHQLSRDPLQETTLSQMFLAIHPAALGASADMNRMADEIVASLHAAAPIEPGRPARYPGEQTLRLREENLRLGIPVDEAIWQQILTL